MLITAIEKEKQDILEQGIEQGKKTKQIEMLIKLLSRRFDDVPEAVIKSLSQCTLDQLDELTNPALDALDLEAFMAQIPEADAATDEETTAADGQGAVDSDDADNGAAA